MEIVLYKIRISRCDQGQLLRPRVRHVSRRVEPILKEEEQAEDKSGRLPLCEEIRGQKKRHEPLQQRASPKSERGAEPSEQIVAAFVNNQIGRIDEQKSATRREGIDEKSGIENEPRNDRWARNRLPWLAQNGLE